MVEDRKETNEDKAQEKFEFTSEGEALSYVSLDQARVLAMRTARDDTAFYGLTYSGRELVREELSAEESEDYYRIRLSYRPAERFNGTPGVELFMIGKLGTIELRQILTAPKSKRVMISPFTLIGVLVVVVIAVGILWTTELFQSSLTGMATRPDTSSLGSESILLSPDASAELTSPDGNVSVPGKLVYPTLSSSDIAILPEDSISMPASTPVPFNISIPDQRISNNLAPNPSFDQGSTSPTGWTASTRGSDAVLEWDEKITRNGDHSLKISGSRSSNRGWPGWETVEVLPIEPGEEYKFSVWTYIESRAIIWMDIDILDSSGKSLGSASSGNILLGQTGEWFQQTKAFNTAHYKEIYPDMTAVKLGLRLSLLYDHFEIPVGSVTSIYYDDVRFEAEH